jgi:hypothetical protein
MPSKPQADRAAARIPTQEEPKEESEETGRSEPEWIEMVLSLARASAPIFAFGGGFPQIRPGESGLICGL